MTRLKALELFGFKSFADRTRFEFPDGITAVVGPNGSGKSNVVDAMKWVLGEQSVRSLRGKEMTDVIFAGSASRKPLNAAETTLVFDNSARRLPIDADEVQIGRRVYRSGESEYLVNGEVSRLRDIRELFSGTGAATEAYSVIEQGRVDALLVASGKERRAVFEEAAGITRFRVRRAEALRRLERAEQNRQRLADIVGEVAARLETLRHQAARARRWRQMTDRLRTLRLAAAREDLALVDAAVAAVEESVAALVRESAEAEGRAAEAAAESSARRDEEAALAPEIERWQAAATAARERVAVAASRRVPLASRAAELAAELLRFEAEARTAAARVRESRELADAAAAARHRHAGEVASLSERLDECLKVSEGSHADGTEARAELVRIAALVEDATSRRHRLLVEADRAAGAEEDCRRATTEARGAIDAARRRIAVADESVALRDGSLGALRARAAETAAALADAEGLVRERTATVERGWRELSGWEAKLEACRERRAVLGEIAARHEGLAESARRILGVADAAAGIVGVLGETVEATVEWAGLVDVALGAAAQDIVVGSADGFAAWLEAWASTDDGARVLSGGGRVGVVPAGGTTLPAPSDRPDPTGGEGVVGRLDGLLVAAGSTPPTGPAARLLERVWIVESFAAARRLAAAHPDCTFVARDGRACRGDRMEVGTASAAAGLVSRRAELRALGERHDDLARRVAEHAEAVTADQAALAAAGDLVRQLQTRRQHDAEELAEGRADAARLDRERQAAVAALATAEAALHDAERRTADAARTRGGLIERLAALEADLEDLAERRRRTEGTIADIDRSRGSIVEEINALRVRIAAGQERLARAGDEAGASVRETEERRAALAGVEARLSTTRRRHAEAELEWLSAGASLAEASWTAERAEEALSALGARAVATRTAAEAAATAAETGRASVASIAERLHARHLEAGEARHRRARIVERIRDEYDIDIDAFAAVPAADDAGGETDPIPADRADLDAAIEDLRRKLASMQTVNLEALTESEQLAERLAGLEGQLADVTGAKHSIEQLIARIDEESRRLLAETFEVVRGHFRTLFERVFGGGQADIVLEPGVDVLETSVEIVARPPGKEPRSISLLSGGEKTMTCVALLLAIFRSRPSPFCVLDEVDAALDEANVDRFVGVLREFTNTQIILVTHRKATMAAADTLYGVTMEESGVSKRVSVRFESAAAASAHHPRAAA